MRRASIAALLSAALLILATGALAHSYKGKTAQGRPIQISLKAHSITLVRAKVRLRCLDGTILFDDLSDFEATPLSHGRFKDIQLGVTDELSWSGRASKANASGKLRVKDKLSDGVRCDSGFVGFEVGLSAG